MSKKTISFMIMSAASFVIMLSIGFQLKDYIDKPETIFLSASWAMAYSGIEDLTDSSDLIAIIKVNAVEKEYEISNVPLTQYNATVLSAEYNCNDGDNIIITMTGVNNKEKHVEIKDDPLLEKGQEFLIFAQKNTDGTYSILGGPQGRLKYNNGKLTSMQNVTSRVIDAPFDIKDLDKSEISKEIQKYKKSN